MLNETDAFYRMSLIHDAGRRRPAKGVFILIISERQWCVFLLLLLLLLLLQDVQILVISSRLNKHLLFSVVDYYIAFVSVMAGGGRGLWTLSFTRPIKLYDFVFSFLRRS